MGQRLLRIAIADDHELFREGLKSLLAARDGFEVVAEIGAVDDILPAIDSHPCDVLLLDLRMDRGALSEVAALCARVPVVVVTASDVPEDLAAAIHAGARGVVLKCGPLEDLIGAIRVATEGGLWMPPSLRAQLGEAQHETAQHSLTPREREIVHHVALGLRNAEVAEKLFISEQTVKTHLNNVFEKVGVRDRVELTLYAIRAGIIGSHDRPPG
jgi:DNA-binding NarL/FixJ family response regulator